MRSFLRMAWKDSGAFRAGQKFPVGGGGVLLWLLWGRVGCRESRGLGRVGVQVGA